MLLYIAKLQPNNIYYCLIVPNEATYRQMQTIHNTNNNNILQVVQNTANTLSTVISNISLDFEAATHYFSTVDRVFSNFQQVTVFH